MYKARGIQLEIEAHPLSPPLPHSWPGLSGVSMLSHCGSEVEGHHLTVATTTETITFSNQLQERIEKYSPFDSSLSFTGVLFLFTQSLKPTLKNKMEQLIYTGTEIKLIFTRHHDKPSRG